MKSRTIELPQLSASGTATGYSVNLARLYTANDIIDIRDAWYGPRLSGNENSVVLCKSHSLYVYNKYTLKM